MLVSKNELAKSLGVSTATVHRLMNERAIPFYRIRNSPRFDVVDVRASLQENGTAQEWKRLEEKTLREEHEAAEEEAARIRKDG